MLLRLIDSKFETLSTKVDGVATSLNSLALSVAQITARYDGVLSDHDHRIGSIEHVMAQRALQVTEFEGHKLRIAELEKARLTSEARMDGASKAAKWAWSALGALAVIMGGLGYQLHLEAKAPVEASR